MAMAMAMAMEKPANPCADNHLCNIAHLLQYREAALMVATETSRSKSLAIGLVN
jgi:hypothetical protein